MSVKGSGATLEYLSWKNWLWQESKARVRAVLSRCRDQGHHPMYTDLVVLVKMIVKITEISLIKA